MIQYLPSDGAMFFHGRGKAWFPPRRLYIQLG